MKEIKYLSTSYVKTKKKIQIVFYKNFNKHTEEEEVNT